MKKPKIKIYDVNYLMSAELTEDDLYNLCERKSLIYSLIVGLFNESKYKFSEDEIIKICTSSNMWPYKYFWTKRQHDSYLKKLTAIYKNIYQYSDIKCKTYAEWFLIKYGLTNNKVPKKSIGMLN